MRKRIFLFLFLHAPTRACRLLRANFVQVLSFPHDVRGICDARKALYHQEEEEEEEASVCRSLVKGFFTKS